MRSHRVRNESDQMHPYLHRCTSHVRRGHRRMCRARTTWNDLIRQRFACPARSSFASPTASICLLVSHAILKAYEAVTDLSNGKRESSLVPGRCASFANGEGERPAVQDDEIGARSTNRNNGNSIQRDSIVELLCGTLQEDQRATP